MAETWDKLKRLLGYGPDCVNGGSKMLNGECRCGDYYTGRLCETILCMNEATVINNGTACECPDKVHYRGRHCERLLCENAGKDAKNGSCKCLEPWYTGRFCEEYANPWLIIFGVVGGVLLTIVLLCVFCRLRPGCNKSAQSRRRRPRVASDISLESNEMVGPSLPAPLVTNTYVLHPNHLARPAPPSSLPPHVFKLEAPPPSYDEVIRGIDKFPTEPPPPPEFRQTSGETRNLTNS